jgi:hypothetical protein
MDTSEMRKRILRALDEARREIALRRRDMDEATEAYRRWLDETAVPLVRQVAGVLKAEGHAFTVHSPAGVVRLVSDGTPQTFLEIELDTRGMRPQVIGRVSLSRGRQGVVVEEAPLSAKPVPELSEEDVSEFLTRAIPRLVLRR